MSQTEQTSKPKFLNFKTYQVLIPAVLGTMAIIWLFLKEFDISSFKEIQFNGRMIFFILLGCLLMVGRDIGMMARFRLMTNREISWRQAFDINILREFTSAIMPAAIGAGPTVIIALSKEGINPGRSTTIAITNLFLDDLFFVLICPVIFLFVPLAELFNNTGIIASTINIVFWVIYPLLCIWTFIMFLGLYVRPDVVSRILRYIFQLKILRRWQDEINNFTENMVTASLEIKCRPFSFWLKVFGVTALTWSSRFLVANALFMAFTHIGNQMVIYGRQVIIWLTMIISPTPGGSGLSEIAFKEFYNDLNLGSGPVLIIVAIWRIISYYIYLFLGVIVFPRWVKRVFPKKSDNENDTAQHQSINKNDNDCIGEDVIEIVEEYTKN